MSLLCRPVHYRLELGVSIQQHQGFSRHKNEAARALQREYRLQDDGISMTLPKQSESTKVGFSAPDEQKRQASHSFKSVWIISNICYG